MPKKKKFNNAFKTTINNINFTDKVLEVVSNYSFTLHIGKIFQNRIKIINMSKNGLKAIEYEKETLPTSNKESKDLLNMELEEVIEYMTGRANNKYYTPKNKKENENN